MCKNAVGALVGVVALLVAASAEAGFVEAPTVTSESGVGFGSNLGEDGNANVSINESVATSEDPPLINFAGATDDGPDPVMSITKVVENTTGFGWIGYQIDLDEGGTAAFTGTPISNAFTLNEAESTDTSLVFETPPGLPTGEAVTFAFDITVPAGGPFGFTMTQTPVIPEPTSLLLGLLAAGASAAVGLRYRWG